MEEPVGRRRRDIAVTDGAKQTGSTVVAATVIAVTVVGPLLGLMSLSLVATTTLFLSVSPLMLIFVPVLMVTVAVLVTAMGCFGVAAAMWTLGIAAMVCVGREIGIGNGVAKRIVESLLR